MKYTVETIHANGNFSNVNEVHNNTGTMALSGFNQEGGKVTGNIGKVEVISRQNTSTTTGSSKGVNLGISANGVPSSVNVNASRTNGSRAFVDNQSTFVVGEGSNLHVETVENIGAVISKEGNSTFRIDTYVGKDIQNHDTMTTTGGSIGVSLGGKPKITNIGFNQDSRDKQGITRNTVVGDIEITKAEGSPINRNLEKANEITKDTHSSTNINIESQTIEYLTNPGKLKENIGKAKKEISDVTTAIKESINDRGDDNRNFFGQLREIRLSETVNNIAGKRLTEAQKSEDVVSAWKDAYKDLGYNLDVKYTTGEDTPEMKDKAGTTYVSKDGVHTIIININAKENSTKAGLIGTLAEEASHIVNGVAGRQITTGTDEKGLESTGRASNAYFQEEYKGSNQNTYKSDGKIDTSKLETNVGDILTVNKNKIPQLNQYLSEFSDYNAKMKCTGEECVVEQLISLNDETKKIEEREVIEKIVKNQKITTKMTFDDNEPTEFKLIDENNRVINIDNKKRLVLVEDKDGNIKWEESPKWLEAGHEWVHDYYSIEGESIHEFVEYWYKDDKGNMKQAGHKVFEMPIIEVATGKVTTIERFKAKLEQKQKEIEQIEKKEINPEVEQIYKECLDNNDCQGPNGNPVTREDIRVTLIDRYVYEGQKLGQIKANLNKNFKDLNNKILEYKNKCPNGFCYDGEEAATIGNVIKNRPDLMRKFNENLFREKRGMNRRISHDAEIKK